MSTTDAGFQQHWREVIATFLKIGALSYGGAASMGIMQTEVQEKRAWLPKEHFIEGLALVNTLPGPAGIQLGIFLGYPRAGWWGGVLAGLCFILPAFCILLSLTLIYNHYSALPRMRHLFYVLSPVVIGVTAVAVLRMVPYAISDLVTGALAMGTGLVLVFWQLSALPLMTEGAAIGLALRARLS